MMRQAWRMIQGMMPKGPPKVNVILLQVVDAVTYNPLSRLVSQAAIGIVQGVIAARRSGNSISLRSLDRVLDRAFGLQDAHKPDAVALLVNSPGGSGVQSSMISGRIRQHADHTKVPVLGFVEDVAASGGYWLLCAADEVYADQASIVGSIGVVAGGFGLVDAMRRVGVERRLFTAGEHKARLDAFKPLEYKDIQKFDTVLKDMHAVFKEHVLARRGEERLKGKEDMVFSGDFFMGNQALELGLIDKIGHMHTVLPEKFGPKVRINYINQRRFSLPFLNSDGMSDASLSLGQRMACAVADEVEARLEESVLRSRFGL